MMDKGATTKSSSATFTLNGVKGQKKKDGTLQAAKWNASLASKIKTKLINNSSMSKVSLQQNNKALALALNVEKENSRKLKNDKICLQKKVENLQLHNILLRQKLNCLNKTLIGIEAFLNDNLLTAIEISSPSENLQSSFPLSADPSSPTDAWFKSARESAGSVELPVKLPLFATANAKQQGSQSLGGIPNSCKCATSLSEQVHSDQVKFASSFPSDKNNQKLIETDPVEATVDKNKFFKENQLCTELNCNGAFVTHVKNTQSLGQSEELTKQYRGSPLPSCGSMTERKKHEVPHKSKTPPNMKDFGNQCRSLNLPLHGVSSGSNTNDMNLQEGSSDLSHIIPSPCKFSIESKTDSKKLLFSDKMKPEETVYDADMELTASDAGELLTVTAKNNNKLHQNKIRNSNPDKILADFRKVKYSKKDKEKVKSMSDVGSNLYTEERHAKADNSETSKTTDSEIQLLQGQTEQLPTGNSAKKRSKTRKAKDTKRIYQVNLMSPRKQEKNEETFSEMFGDMESKIQKADSNSPISKIPPEVYCTKNLAFQDNTSNVLPLESDFLNTSEKDSKPKINRRTFQNSSKANTAKSYIGENGQDGENISKQSQTEVYQCDSKTKQDQKNIVKRKTKKSSSYRESRETENDSIPKISQKDPKRSHFSPGRLKHTLAKAGRKACIMPKEKLAQFSACKSEEVKNKETLHAEAGNKVTETQQMQVALVTQNGIALNIPQAKEQIDNDASMLKRVDFSAVANKNPHITNSSGNQVKQKHKFSSDTTETRREINYFRSTNQSGQNISHDQEVPHGIDSFMSELRPMIQVECSKNMPLNVDRFSQESLSNAQLPPLDNQNASVNFSVLKNPEIREENYHNEALNLDKAEQNMDRISKESHKNTLTPCHGRKAFQDLTNTGTQSRTSIPKSPKTSGENSAAPSRRGRSTVCYKEPNLRSKLRQGDQFTETQFLYSPVYKVKTKRSFKSKSKFT